MAGADRDQHRARLVQPALDPARPIGVAAGQQRILEFRRVAQVAVEASAMPLTSPRLQASSIPPNWAFIEAGSSSTRSQELALGILRQPVEKAELLGIGFELADRLAACDELLLQRGFDARSRIEAKIFELDAEQQEGGRPGFQLVERLRRECPTWRSP